MLRMLAHTKIPTVGISVFAAPRARFRFAPPGSPAPTRWNESLSPRALIHCHQY